MNFDNEISIAKSLENIDFSKDKDYYSKCVLLARYWITLSKSKDYIQKEIYKRLKSVYFDFGENVILTEVSNILKIAYIKGPLQYKIIRFCKEELDFIHSFNHLNFEKMLFIMFCAYKIEEDNEFSLKLRELMRLAKNSYNKTYCTNLLSKSYQNDIFDMKVSYGNTLKYFPTKKTLDLFNEENIILEITNFKNLVFYYLQYINHGNYIKCKRCGCIDRKNSNRQEYCVECSKEVQLICNREYMRKNKIWINRD